MALSPAIKVYTPSAIHDAGTWIYIIRTISPWRKSAGEANRPKYSPTHVHTKVGSSTQVFKRPERSKKADGLSRACKVFPWVACLSCHNHSVYSVLIISGASLIQGQKHMPGLLDHGELDFALHLGKSQDGQNRLPF